MTASPTANGELRPADNVAPRASPIGERPLRILTTIDSIGIGGGAEHLLAMLLPALKRLGHEVEVAPVGDWEPDLAPTFQAGGVPVHYLRANGPAALFDGAVKLRRLLAAGPYDLVWSHSRLANLVARLASFGWKNAPIQVATFHSEGYARIGRLPLRARVTTAAEGRLLRGVSKVAVSRAVAQDYEAFFGWTKMEVVHNCVDPSSLPPPLTDGQRVAIRARYGVEDGIAMIVVPSRFVHKKGHAVLLDALARLRAERGWRPRVLCFGVGPLKDEIARDAARLGLDLDVIVSVPQAELFRAVRAADLVALPSLREPFGIAAVEAMALGAPLVASDVDGLGEILSGRDCALLVPPGDSDALAGAIWSVHENTDAARARAARAVSVARRFELPAAAARWAAVLQEAASRG